MLRARAATSRGVGSAAAAGLVCPMRRRRRTGYWLPRSSGRQWPGAVLQAPGAARRVSSPSKIPHLQVWTLSSRPKRLRAGERSLSRRRRCASASSPGVSKMPLRRCQRAASGPGGGRLATFPPSAREMPLSPAPSALAVPPGFDGFLRCAPRRFRADRVPDQLALSQLPSALLLQPTVGFMPFRRLPLCPLALDPSWCLSAPEPQGS